jgi:DNA modification methylase
VTPYYDNGNCRLYHADALAAQKLGRRAVGVDLSETYLQQAVKRLEGVTLPMAGV